MPNNNNNFANWNWVKKHVSGTVTDGSHIIPDASFVLAGPALLEQSNVGAESGKSILFPLGTIATVRVGTNRTSAPLYEMGAQRGYIVPGKVSFSLTLTNFMLYGPSLLRALYALQPDPQKSGGSVLPGAAAPGSDYAKYFPDNYYLDAGKKTTDTGPSETAENRDFYIALASELFRVPIGVCVVFRNSQTKGYGAFYCEECIVTTHDLSWGAADTNISETVTLDFSLLIPVAISSFKNQAV